MKKTTKKKPSLLRQEANQSNGGLPFSGIPMTPLGKIRPRSAGEISGSNWSVGAETMDRDFTIYDNWKQFLGPLGVKKARLQSGWAKTERHRGVYDWEWLDAIVDDMIRQGVEPWVCLCYGNPVYEGGGGTSLGGLLPAGEGLAAWERYVSAIVRRYEDRVREWEIWNEPNVGPIFGFKDNPPETYAGFFIRTAEAVRAVQPAAHIIALTLAHTDPEYATRVLAVLKAKSKLSLINEISFHPYSHNPDAGYDGSLDEPYEVAGIAHPIKELQDVVAGFSSTIRLRQGENGCPSFSTGFGALSGHPWTELSQSKWALRRLLGDLGHDIPSSYFGIADMCYLWEGQPRLNNKGLLRANADKTIAGPKLAYHAVQHLTSIFDDRLERVPDFPLKAGPGEPLAIFAFRRTTGGGRLVAIWENGHVPGESNEKRLRTFTVPPDTFEKPVYVDLRDGGVWAIPAARWRSGPDGQVLDDIPVYDSPVLIADADILEIT